MLWFVRPTGKAPLGHWGLRQPGPNPLDEIRQPDGMDTDPAPFIRPIVQWHGLGPPFRHSRGPKQRWQAICCTGRLRDRKDNLGVGFAANGDSRRNPFDWEAWHECVYRAAVGRRLAGHAGPGELTRFHIEAEAAARFQHPNIVQIHEVGEANGHPCRALEFVEGGNLADKIKGQPLPAREAARLVEALARAMQLAHSRNVVHRDLKPANILLSPRPFGGEESGLRGLGTPKIHRLQPGCNFQARALEQINGVPGAKFWNDDKDK